jgi:hypothetical protein
MLHVSVGTLLSCSSSIGCTEVDLLGLAKGIEERCKRLHAWRTVHAENLVQEAPLKLVSRM